MVSGSTNNVSTYFCFVKLYLTAMFFSTFLFIVYSNGGSAFGKKSETVHSSTRGRQGYKG